MASPVTSGPPSRQRADAYDRQVLDRYDDEALAQAVRDARRALDEAVAADPLGQAWVRLHTARLRHAHLSVEAATAASHISADRTIRSQTANSVEAEDIARAVDRVATARAADEADARDAAREAAANGASS